jgi:translation initiation factor IF-2
MAKIRVCELAKDLNISNKVLLDRLKSLDIEAKSHLSSLEDDDVVRIRESISGSQHPAGKNRPAVIRRRRDKVKKEQATDTTTDGAELETSLDHPPESEEPDTVQDGPGITPTIGVIAPEAISEEPEFKEPAAAVYPPEIVGETGPKATPAQPELTEAIVDDVEISEPVVPPAADFGEKTASDTAPLSPVSADEMILKPEIEIPPQPEANLTESGLPAATRPEKSGKKKKKQKKDMPARIIALPLATADVVSVFDIPEEIPEKPEKPEKLEKLERPEKKESRAIRKVQIKPEKPAVVTEVTAESTLKDKKKKKELKDIEDEVEARKSAKKKIGFRKKEIVEGAELYAESGRNRKQSRKGGKYKVVAPPQKPVQTTPKAIKRRIRIDDTIVLSDLAKRMGVKASDIIVKLMSLGVMATVNQAVDFDTAALVAVEFSYEVERAAFEEDSLIRIEEDDPAKMIGRPPVVTIMGHVDHGKTSLLDVIRKTRVTEGEAGGITQHIGAYHVATDRGQIVFLDTPGHEAFTAMRSRGASITDLVVLVVAADDGVMPQTLEAINHSRAANVPIIVAVNKMDKPGADPDRILRELADVGLVPEEWGGDTMCVRVSAKAQQGIDDLLDRILLQAEVLELKADPNRLAFGHVVEAKLDSGRGPVATVLVQQGTLKAGDPVVCGIYYGKVRSLLDDRGVQVESAGPSIPVEVIGLSGIPVAGDELIALSDEKDARNVSVHRFQKQRAKELAKTNRLSLDKLFEKMKEGEVRDLNIIIKADVQGSIEALSDSLVKLSNDEVNINVVHAGAGAITESDISLAAVSNAIIIGFNVRPTAKVQSMAADEHVDMRFYNIIYNVIKDVKDAILGMMKSTFEERILGRAQVRAVYTIPKIGVIAGCYVTDGKIQRGRPVRVIRDGIVAFEGKIGSLKRFKDDAKEVLTGYECGVGIENFNDVKQNDVFECYYLEELKPEAE